MSLRTEIDEKILQTLKKYIPSAKIYLVGGAVRDFFMSRKSKDRDYVVENASLHEISEAISTIGKVNEVGKSFGIVKAVIDGEEYDFAVPRTEISTGLSHLDFIVDTDGVTIYEDLSRRDFTMNAIAYDIENDVFLDPFSGIKDIENGKIKFCGSPIKRYSEDPLRLLRMIQFSHRFSMKCEAPYLPTNYLYTVSKERIYEEYRKMFLKGVFLSKSEYIFKNPLAVSIHKDLFGMTQFVPGDIEVTKVSDMDDDDVVNTYLIALFLYDGNYKGMCMTNDNIDHIEMARRIHRVTRGTEQFEPSNFKNKHLVKSVRNIFRRYELMVHLAKSAGHIFNTPTTIKEMALSGSDLMSIGIVGQDIGNLVREWSLLMYRNELENTKESLLDYINNSKRGTINGQS